MESRVNVSHVLDGGEVVGQGGFGQVHVFQSVHDKDISDVLGNLSEIVVNSRDGSPGDEEAKQYVLNNLPNLAFKTFYENFDKAKSFSSLKSNEEEVMWENISNSIVRESTILAMEDSALKTTLQKVGIPTDVQEFIDQYTPLSAKAKQIFVSNTLHNVLVYERFDGDIIGMYDQINWSDDTLKSMLKSALALLVVLHANGFYHMDIKPENILYKKESKKFCLADYGLISDSWTKNGTLAYMSPLLNTQDVDDTGAVLPAGVEVDGKYVTFVDAADKDSSAYTILGMSRQSFLQHHAIGGGLLGALTSSASFAAKGISSVAKGTASAIGRTAVTLGRVALSPLVMAVRTAHGVFRMIRPKNQKVFFSRRFTAHPLMKERLGPHSNVNEKNMPAFDMPPNAIDADELPVEVFEQFGFTLAKHDLFALGMTLHDILQVNTTLPQDVKDKYIAIAKRMVFAVPIDGLTPFQTVQSVLDELFSSPLKTSLQNKNSVPMNATFLELVKETLDACLGPDPDDATDNKDMTVAIKKFITVHYSFKRYRDNNHVNNNVKHVAIDVDKEYDTLLSKRKRGEGLDMEVVYEICLYYELLRLFYKLQRQNAIMEKGFGKLKTKLMNTTFEILAKSEDMQEIVDIISKYYNDSSFPTLLSKLSTEIITLGNHILDALQGITHPETGLKELFKSSTQISTDAIAAHVYKELDIDEIVHVYQRELDKNKVKADLSDLHTDDVFDASIVQGEQFYAMILLRSFKLEMDYWKRMFALYVALLRCTQFGTDCNLPVSEDVLRKQLQRVLRTTSDVYKSFIRMFKAEKRTIDISIPLTAQDQIERQLSSLSSHLHMKFANVASKFLQYASNKKDATNFQKRLCKYLEQLPMEYTDKSLTTIEEYTKHLNRVYKSSMFGVNTKEYVSPYADLKLDVKCNRDKIDRLLATSKLLGGVQEQFHPIREVVSGNIDEIRKFIGGLDPGMVKTLNTALQSDQLKMNDTIRRFGYEGQQKYIQFVKFYENVSGAVRVFIRLKDNLALANCPNEVDKLQNLKCAAATYSNEKKTEKWAYSAPSSPEDIVILNESEIKLRDESKNQLVTFGPFFKVIPPYTRTSWGKYKRVDNNVIADKFVDVDNMAQLLTGDVQNLVLFTYGYSGSGKTYTLFGNIKDMSSHDGVVYSIIDSIQKVVIANDPENPEDITIPMVTLKKIHQVYGYITSELTLLEPENLNKSDLKNVVLPQGTYHGLLKETLENYMSRADANKENLEDDFIKNTPNNPDSSRGFLIVEFEIMTKVNGKDQVNKLCVVDMAGNEHPYDILMKTIPTFNLSLKDQVNDNLLVSSDIRKKDEVTNILSNSISGLLSDVLLGIKNQRGEREGGIKVPLQALGTLVSSTNLTPEGKKTLYAKPLSELERIRLPLFHKTLHPVLMKIEPRLEDAYERLSSDFKYMIHRMLFKLGKSVVDAGIASKVIKDNLPPFYNDHLAKLKGYNNYGLFAVTSNPVKEGRKWDVTLNVIMDNDPLAVTLLFVYYVAEQVFNKETLVEVGLLKGDANDQAIFELFKKDSITQTDSVLNAMIEKILYGNDKSDAKIAVLNKLKLLKFIVAFIITHPICNDPKFAFTKRLINDDANTNAPIISVTIGKQSDSSPLKVSVGSLQDDVLNQLFSSMVLNVRIPDRKESPEIKAKSGYFERIIREGYYINQVNYELIRFFFLRGMSDDAINRNMLKDKKMDYDVLTINKYSSMLHIDTQKPVDEKVAATQPWCMTSMLSKMHQILNESDDAKEENNKYMMICNVRPEPNKFRLGAFQTLELVKTLSST